jgi:hypothetical protein
MDSISPEDPDNVTLITKQDVDGVRGGLDYRF